MLGLNPRRVFVVVVVGRPLFGGDYFSGEHVCQQLSFADIFYFLYGVQIILRNGKHLRFSERLMARIHFPFSLLLIFFVLISSSFSEKTHKKIRRIPDILCIAKKNNRPYCCLHPALKLYLAPFTVGQNFTPFNFSHLSLAGSKATAPNRIRQTSQIPPFLE